MKSPKYLLLFLTMLVGLALPGVANATNPNGWWTSSSGSQVHIKYIEQNVYITLKATNGKTYKYNGRWTVYGATFSYSVPGRGVFNAAFANGNPDVIYVHGPDGKRTTWYRGIKNTKSNNQQSQKGIAGTWRSSTGTTIQLSGKQKQLFFNFITAKGQRYQGVGRWLSGYSFDYSIAGYGGVAKCNVNKNNWNIINCVYNGTKSTWKRY